MTNPNASSRKDIRAQEKAAKLAETNNREVVANLMSTLIGRAWVHSKLESCHMFNDPFTGNALLDSYRKGERNVGLVILADLMAHCPDLYIQMMREENDRRTASERARSQDGNGGDQGRLDDGSGTEEPRDPEPGTEASPGSDIYN